MKQTRKAKPHTCTSCLHHELYVTVGPHTRLRRPTASAIMDEWVDRGLIA